MYLGYKLHYIELRWNDDNRMATHGVPKVVPFQAVNEREAIQAAKRLMENGPDPLVLSTIFVELVRVLKFP